MVRTTARVWHAGRECVKGLEVTPARSCPGHIGAMETTEPREEVTPVRKILSTDKAPTFKKYALSQGVETESYVFTAGMAFDEHLEKRMEAAESIQDETRICLRAIDSVLAEAGCSLRDVVKTTVYLTDRAHYSAMNEAYREFWREGDYPARCTFYVGIGGDCRVEIDAIAVKPRPT
jgi:2-iminobutanoate/2-iminopropanoate deaminase